MIDCTITVFGPSNGLRAVQLPDCNEIDQSIVAISEFDFDVADRGRLLWMRRLPSAAPGASPRLVFVLAEQIYEPNLRRLGHMFGVAFEFGNEVPSGIPLIDTASDILNLLRDHCTSDSRFFDHAVFLAQVKAHVLPFHDGFIPALGTFVKRPLAAPIQWDKTGRHQTVAGLQSNAGTAYFVDWFLKGLGSLSCERLVISESTSGRPGQSLQPLQDPTRYDATVYESLSRTTNAAIDELRGKAGQLNQLRMELKNRIEENRLLAADIEQARMELDHLTRENEDLRGQLLAIRRRAGDDANRLASHKQDASGTVNLLAVVAMSEQLSPKLAQALGPVLEQRVDSAVKRCLDTPTKVKDVADDFWVKCVWFASGAAVILIVASVAYLVSRLLSY
jgi:hypothetical protein